MARRRRRSGARRIADILDTPQTDLNRAIATAGRGLFPSAQNPEEALSRGTYRGISVVRAEYQSMRRRIKEIDTGRQDAKADVLDALTRFDSALGAYAKALPSGNRGDGATALVKAAGRARRASADLEKARGRLT
jgi:hypothetical protein